jgi:hypothetical protein
MSDPRSALRPAFLLFLGVLLPALTSVLAAQTDANARVRQLAELTAPDGFTFQAFGSSVAMSGGTVVAGAPTQIGGSPEGAYVFVKTGGSWVQAAELNDGLTEGAFGASVAIGGGTIAVASVGAVYVFVEPASGWADMPPTAVLSVAGGPENFAQSVSISADGATVVAGAVGLGGPGSGAAYIFVRPADGWASVSEPTATLSYSAAWALGNSVAISGDGNTVVAGSIGESALGMAYVFTKPHGGWRSESPAATLTNSDQGVEDAFGYSVAVSPTGSTIVIGDPGKAVYVFDRPTGGWRTMTQTAELTVVAHEVDTQLGWSVALSGNVILAGAPDIFIGHQNPGAAFAYLKPSGGWANTSNPNLSVTSSDGASGDGFGEAVALSGTFGIVGAPQHAVNGNAEQGAAYIFGEQ